MKPLAQLNAAKLTNCPYNTSPRISTLILTAILALSCSLTLPSTASGETVKGKGELKLNRLNLPKSVAEAVLKDVAGQVRTRLPIGLSNIVKAERTTWSNGCMGLIAPHRLCTMALVEGWIVNVAVGPEVFVYHTNNSSLVKLNEQASRTIGDSFQPMELLANELPTPLQDGAIFRAIASGGIAGRTYETTLFKNGQVRQVLIAPDGQASQPQMRRISQRQVRQFSQLLERQQDRFKNLDYPAPRGGADYISYTLTTREGNIRYNDISQSSLPKALQEVIQAWNQISLRVAVVSR